jgi:endoglycosylceramidase
MRRSLSLAAAIALAVVTGAEAAPTPPLGHEGRWITDARGRVVILHGINMVYKRRPYHPAAAGFNDGDARFLARHGFNNVRLGLIYAGVEPEPGLYDGVYLRRIKRTQQILARHRVFSMLDFHQDLYNERFTGEGFPDWAVLDGAAPPGPTIGFPGTYVTSLGLNAAFDSLWENRRAPDGLGLQDHYAAAWRHVAARFRREPYVLGYDLINEPWPGSAWPTCANLDGCPRFEVERLAPFQGKAIAAIRDVDRRHLVWYEPVITAQFGHEFHHPDTGDPRAGISFHIYCLTGAFGIPALDGLSCPTLEELAMTNANQHAERNGDTLLMSEFGATESPAVIRRMTALADEQMTSWQWWHYCNCADPTTSGVGDRQAIVSDPAKPPRGDNLFRDKLALIERPYPQAVAGTPTRFRFDPDTTTFELEYSTVAPSGRTVPRPVVTEIYVPRIHYPAGYRVRVDGARVVSEPGARVLRLRRMRGAGAVAVIVTAR